MVEVHTEQSENEKTKSLRLKQGIVLKNKMDKTVVVEVRRRVRHAKYSKFLTKRIRYTAHDKDNACHVGDWVTLEETKPMSKTKRWKVVSIDRRAMESA